MTMDELITGTPTTVDDALTRATSGRAFSERRIDFLDLLGRQLARHDELPAVVALGFWLREANLRPEVERRTLADALRVPRGLAVHVAPGNVPTMFAYSWAVSFLAGNANVVRLPSQVTPERTTIVDAVARLSAADENGWVRGSNLFVDYPSERMDITSALSSAADARVIWGGDDTVVSIRKLSSPPACVDVVFVDKKSLAVLGAEAVRDAPSSELQEVARRFRRDGYTFNQLACSSPAVVVFVGTETAADEASHRFWTAVAADGGDQLRAAAIPRMVRAFEDAMDGIGRPSGLPRGDGPHHVRLKDEEPMPIDVAGGGYFYEKVVTDVGELPRILRHQQTLSYWGVSSATELAEACAQAGSRCVDRIVPLGTALDFAPRWDGYDLLAELSRIVVVQ